MTVFSTNFFKILLFLAILSSSSASLEENQAEISQACVNNLRSYISQLRLHLPDIRTKIDLDSIKVYNLTLYELNIEYLSISYLPEQIQNGNSIIIKLKVNQMSINGTIDYKKIPFLIKPKIVLSDLIFNIPLELYKGNSEIYESVKLLEDSFFSQLSNFTIIVSASLESLGKKYLAQLKDLVLDTVNNKTAIYDLLNPLVSKFGNQLFEKINKCLNSKVNRLEQITIPIQNADKFIPIIKSPVVDILRFCLNNLVSNISSPLNLNNLINVFKGDDEILTLTRIGKQFDFTVPVNFNLQPPSDFTLEQLSVDGINSWSNLLFLNPSQNSRFILDSHLNLGNIKINVSSLFKLPYNEFSTSQCIENLNFLIELEKNKIDLGVQIAAPIDGGLNYTNDQFLDIVHLVNLVDKSQTGITKLHLNTFIKNFDYKIDGGFDGYLFETIDFLLDFIIKKNIDLIPRFLNGFVYENVLSFDLIEKPLQLFDKKPPEIGVIATGICFGVAVFLGASLCIIIAVMAKVNQKSDTENKWTLFWRIDRSSSLSMSLVTPIWIRLIITIILFADIALFLSSDFSIGASLYMKLIFGENPTVYLPSLFDFSFITMVQDMWLWGSYFLAILLFLISCLWPLVKLTLMVIVWILPTNVMKIRVRSHFLRVLDELGKWSILDSFVLIIMFVAFHLNLTLPIYNTNEIESPTLLNLWFYPEYGFISLILATLISSVLSNLMIYLNRKMKKDISDKNVNHSKIERKAVCKMQHWSLNLVCLILLIAALSTFTYGLFGKSMKFFCSGYAGWFINLLGLNTTEKFSIIELGVHISKSSENPNSFGIRITQIIFFILVVVVPYVHMVLLFFLLFLPMNRKSLIALYYASRTIYAWSCLDVFAISIFVSVFVIGKMTVEQDTCEIISPLIKNYFEKGDMCFSITEKIESGSIVLIFAAAFYIAATIWINVKAKMLYKYGDNKDGGDSDASLSESEKEEEKDSNDDEEQKMIK